ncbi:MAG: glycosyltransferase family 2 protein [Deltaproteobacteria bacterium]|nr:glycosyltransferase family 2 protein [Deltaproteobacteria bacterium]MCL5277891.1 glycosyltransferase family 2 protein [Deltaproteobacteria bacterium]
MQPKVSIIIPTYNRARYLDKTIKSALAQTFEDFELIIVDDGSTDDSRQVIDPYLSDPRVRYIYQENRERCAARNNGLRNSRGRYIALLDSDDLWLPDHLESCLKRAREIDKPALIFSNSLVIDQNDRIISRLYRRVHEGHVMDEIVKRLASDFSPSASFIPKTIFDDVGYFLEAEDFSAGEDTERWICIANKYPFFSTHRFTVLYRANTQSDIDGAANAEKTLRRLIDILLANKTLPAARIERLIHRWQYTTFADVYCHFGDMKRARSYLYRAIKRNKGQLFEPRWWWVLLKSIMGKAMIRRLKGIVRS